MLRALREIVAADVGLPIRAGVNRGHVFTGDIGGANRRTYAVMGDAVNLAARLTSRAQPGDDPRHAPTSSTARRRSTRPRRSRCSSRARSAPSRRTTSARRSARATRRRSTPTPIVGREPELELLRDAVNAARMRELRIVELVGEPGIGKSRLVRELRTLALGFTQLTAAGEQYASSTPFFAVAQPAPPARGHHARPLPRARPARSSRRSSPA